MVLTLHVVWPSHGRVLSFLSRQLPDKSEGKGSGPSCGPDPVTLTGLLQQYSVGHRTHTRAEKKQDSPSSSAVLRVRSGSRHAWLPLICHGGKFQLEPKRSGEAAQGKMVRKGMEHLKKESED